MRIVAPRAEDLAFGMAWHFTDSGEHWLCTLSHGALSSRGLAHARGADVSATLEGATLDALLLQQLSAAQALASGHLKLAGQAPLLVRFFGLLDHFAGNFPVVDAAAVAQSHVFK